MEDESPEGHQSKWNKQTQIGTDPTDWKKPTEMKQKGEYKVGKAGKKGVG